MLLPLHVKETFHIGCNAKCKGLNLFRFSMILPKKIEKVGAVCDLLDQSIWLKSTQGKISSVNSMENSTAHRILKVVFCCQNFSKFEAEGQEFATKFEITSTIYPSIERSEHFLVTYCFLTSSWRFLISHR